MRRSRGPRPRSAPIDDVLFSLEEGASFWSTKLTWRAFFCAMTTLYVLTVVRTAETYWNKPDATAMFSFGEFHNLQEGVLNYSVWECFLFIVVGTLGGLLGAAFNGANARLSRARQRWFAPPAGAGGAADEALRQRAALAALGAAAGAGDGRGRAAARRSRRRPRRARDGGERGARARRARARARRARPRGCAAARRSASRC